MKPMLFFKTMCFFGAIVFTIVAIIGILSPLSNDNAKAIVFALLALTLSACSLYKD